MELYEIKNGLDKAHLLIDEYRKSAQIDEKLREIEGLSYQTMQDDFWDDPTKAKKIYDELNDMKKITDEYESLCQSLNSLDETYTLVKETDDQEFQTILESDYQDFEQRMSEFEKILLWFSSDSFEKNLSKIPKIKVEITCKENIKTPKKVFFKRAEVKKIISDIYSSETIKKQIEHAKAE